MNWRLIVYLFIIIAGCNTSNTNDRYNTNKFRNVDEKLDSIIIESSIENNEDFITLKVVDKFELSNYFNFDDIIDSIWYLPLETNKQSLIENIEKVIIHNECVYVLDIFSNRLLKFNSTGGFITQIGKEGRGPEEYISPIDFEIINDEILVLDDRPNNIKYYSLDGKFLKKENIVFRMNHFIPSNTSRFFCNVVARGNFHIPQISNFKLVICTPDWKIIGSADKYNAELESKQSFSRKVLTKSTNNLVYNPSFDYFIYNIEGDIIKKKYYIDVGQRQLPEGTNNLTNEEFIEKCLSKDCNVMFMFHSVFETDKHLVATLHYNSFDIPLYYSKNSGKLICNKHYKLSPKFPFGFIVPKDINNNTLVGYLEPYFALQKINNFKKIPEEFEKIPQKVKKLISGLNEDDNPILVFFTLKDF